MKSTQLLHDFGDGKMVPAHRHPNGGGWVSETAHASKTAFIGWHSEVCGNARVLNWARVEGASRISDDAVVCDRATVLNACVRGTARVCHHARLEGPWLYDPTTSKARVILGGDSIIGSRDQMKLNAEGEHCRRSESKELLRFQLEMALEENKSLRKKIKGYRRKKADMTKEGHRLYDTCNDLRQRLNVLISNEDIRRANDSMRVLTDDRATIMADLVAHAESTPDDGPPWCNNPECEHGWVDDMHDVQPWSPCPRCNADGSKPMGQLDAAGFMMKPVGHTTSVIIISDDVEEEPREYTDEEVAQIRGLIKHQANGAPEIWRDFMRHGREAHG
jgi:hypothetical protein